MKVLTVFPTAVFLFISAPALRAVDVTPPTLDITHTWIEKAGTVSRFKMLLDPRDDVGMKVDNILFRSALNTSTIPASQPWQWMPWKRGEPFDLGFTCTSCVIELRARDAAGNLSPVQKRTFASPFPYGPAPNLTPMIISAEQFTGPTASCRGLFVGRFDGVGTGDDLVQVDRATGQILVHRMINNQASKHDVSFSVPANTLDDSASADFDSDSRADLAIIAGGALTVYHNDGLDGSGVVQFGAQTVSLAGTGITTFNNIAVGDVTGDGKLDIVVSGTDSGGATRIGWLIADAVWQYTSSDGAPAPLGSTPGKLAFGDMNGDGTLDVVMVDAAQTQMILFKNKGQGVLAGDGEPDVNFQPVLIPTGLGNAGPPPNVQPLINAPVHALAIGDVTGDGRPDIVTTIHALLFSNPDDSNDGRTQQHWRLYENRGASDFYPHTNLKLGESPVSQTVLEDIPSDVMLMELNNDRFPEMLFTNYYNNTVKIIRFTPLLSPTNTLTTLDDGTDPPELDEQDYAPKINPGDPALTGPGRLAKGKLNANALNSIAIAFAGSDTVRWEVSQPNLSSANYGIARQVSTDADPNGTQGANGFNDYFVYPDGTIDCTLAATNNSGTDLTGVFMDCTFPPSLTLLTDVTDPGWQFVTAGGVKYLRWPVNVPNASVVSKFFRARVAPTAKTGVLNQTCYLRKNTSTTTYFARATQPKITIDEPISFDLVSVASDSDTTGRTVHFGEVITYKMKVTNKGGTPITDTKIGMNMPAGTIFNGPVSQDPEAPHVLSAGNTHIDFTVSNLNPGGSKEVFVNVEVRANPPTIIKNTTMTALRPSGVTRKLPGVETEVREALKVTISSDHPAGASPGENIEFTLFAENWGIDNATSCQLVCQIPPGTNLVSARGDDGTGNFTDAPINVVGLTQTSAPAYFRDTTGLNRVLRWNLGTIPGAPLNSGQRPRRTMMFTLKVGADTPTEFNLGGLPAPVSIALDRYNLMFTPITGGNKFIFPRASEETITNPFNQLPKGAVDYAAIPVNNSNPQPKPLLQLTKSVFAPRDANAPDPFDSDSSTAVYPILTRLPGSGDTPFTVLKNTSLTYTLHYANYGNVPARNVKVHDVIPAGMVFQGFVAKDRVLLPSTVFSRFYDASGNVMPNVTADTFTDTNGNGFYDSGEPFADNTGNGKYDGVIADKVRSLDLHAGDVPSGESHRFFYQVRCTKEVGSIVTSMYGGVFGIPSGLGYDRLDGYYLTSDDLYFPVNGGPLLVQVKVINPSYPGYVLKSGVKSAGEVADEASLNRNSLAMSRSSFQLAALGGDDTNAISVAMPFDIRAGGPVANLKMVMQIPEGYVFQSGQVLDKAGANAGKNVTATHGGVGPCDVTFPIDGMTFGWPIMKVGFDPAILAKDVPNVLFNQFGETLDPLLIKVTMSGTNAVTQTSQILVDARADVSKDSKMFVGRAAPLAVSRDGEITYVLFVGNLTDKICLAAKLQMKIPAGCTYVPGSGSDYNDNWLLNKPFDISNVGQPTRAFYNEKTRTISWGLILNPCAGGAVTFKVKVPKEYKADRVDDNTCTLSSRNCVTKTPGPMSVAVRGGNADAEGAQILQRWMQGGSFKNNDAIVNALVTNLQLGDNSYGITVGGADILQLDNGMSIIPLPQNRVMILAPPPFNIFTNHETIVRLLASTSGLRVYAGPDGPVSFGLKIHHVPGYPASNTLPAGEMSPNKVLIDLANTSDNILTREGANVIVGGGRNLVKSGGPTFDSAGVNGSNPPQFVLPEDAETFVITPPVALSASLLVDPNAPHIVRAGNGSAVLAKVPGQPRVVVAPGAGLVGSDGSSLVGGDGASLVGEDGASVVANDGAGVVSNDGAGVVANDGAGLLGKGGAGVVANDGAGIVAAGGGNIVAAGGGNIVAGGGGNIVAGGGGNIVAGGGGNIVAGGGGNIVAGGGGNIVAGGGGN